METRTVSLLLKRSEYDTWMGVGDAVAGGAGSEVET